MVGYLEEFNGDFWIDGNDKLDSLTWKLPINQGKVKASVSFWTHYQNDVKRGFSLKLFNQNLFY